MTAAARGASGVVMACLESRERDARLRLGDRRGARARRRAPAGLGPARDPRRGRTPWPASTWCVARASSTSTARSARPSTKRSPSTSSPTRSCWPWGRRWTAPGTPTRSSVTPPTRPAARMAGSARHPTSEPRSSSAAMPRRAGDGRRGDRLGRRAAAGVGVGVRRPRAARPCRGGRRPEPRRACVSRARRGRQPGRRASVLAGEALDGASCGRRGPPARRPGRGRRGQTLSQLQLPRGLALRPGAGPHRLGRPRRHEPARARRRRALRGVARRLDHARVR